MKNSLFLILLIFIAVACSPSADEGIDTVTDSQTQAVEPPCDDEEAPKVEISEMGINLLDEEEGCKLEK